VTRWPAKNSEGQFVLNPLTFRPTLAARETAPSFLSRMAAMNGVSSAEFAVDMGFSQLLKK
jgi:hypothetical protein